MSQGLLIPSGVLFEPRLPKDGGIVSVLVGLLEPLGDLGGENLEKISESMFKTSGAINGIYCWCQRSQKIKARKKHIKHPAAKCLSKASFFFCSSSFCNLFFLSSGSSLGFKGDEGTEFRVEELFVLKSFFVIIGFSSRKKPMFGTTE